MKKISIKNMIFIVLATIVVSSLATYIITKHYDRKAQRFAYGHGWYDGKVAGFASAFNFGDHSFQLDSIMFEMNVIK